MKKLFITELILLVFLVLISSFSYAVTDTVNISLDDLTVNGEAISTDITSAVYHSSRTDNGATEETSKKVNIDVKNIITITKPGNYSFTGTLEDGQIAVNANEISGEVNIILDNASITCENAPGLLVYHKDIKNEDCKITVTTTKNSENTISGSRIKESVEGWVDQDKVLYSIEKNYDDDGSYYERYKYDGAISTDISITFEGEGTLNVISTKKEGIETKHDITINSGNLFITSLDDAINACADGESIITINGGCVVANISLDAEEGDGIDSNGNFYINGGTVYAFAYPGADNGLDADKGVEIRGGTVFSIGNMYEPFTSSSNNSLVQTQLSSRVSAEDSIIFVDENNDVIFAYKSDRTFSTVAFTSPDMQGKNLTIYTGTDIEGTTDNFGVYTNISNFDLDKLTKQTSNDQKLKNFDTNSMLQSNQNPILTIVFIVVAAVLLLITFICDLKAKNSKKVSLILNLLIGLIIGGLITFVGMQYFVNTRNINNNRFDRNMNQMMPQMPNGQTPPEKPSFEIPEGMENIKNNGRQNHSSNI